MTNFPLDVQRAEELTKGNVDILKSFDTPVKPKPAPATSATSSPATASPTMKILETPVVSKKQLGQYNSAEKVQTCSSPAAKLDSKKFTCTMCHFATDRMNLLMFHIKNHSSTFVTKVHGELSVMELWSRTATAREFMSNFIKIRFNFSRPAFVSQQKVVHKITNQKVGDRRHHRRWRA